MSKKCGCNIISFGHLNWYMLLIPLGAIFKATKDIVLFQSKKLHPDEINEPEKQHPVIITINYAMGLCLSFILLIIFTIYNKGHNNKNILPLSMIVNTQYKKITKKEKFLWILLSTPFDFFANLVYAYNWIKEEDYISLWSSNILSMTFFSFLILKMKLYKHHYLSIIIIIILSISFNFISGVFDKFKETYKGNIIILFTEGTFNALYVLYKFFMLKKFIKSYIILFFQGLIELILGIIILIIATNYYPKLDNFKTYIDGIDGKEIAIFCSLVVINFATFLTIYIIIDLFTPFHIFLLNIVSDLIMCILDGSFVSETYKTLLYYLFTIIGFFMVCVFIESIQLNFCGLSTMTKKNIEERAKIDTILLNKNDDLDDDIICKQKILIDNGDYNFELEDIDSNKNGQILHIN